MTTRAGDAYDVEWSAFYDDEDVDPVTLTATAAVAGMPGWNVEVELVLREGRIVPRRVGAVMAGDSDNRLPPARVLERFRLPNLGEQLEWELRSPGIAFMVPKEWMTARAELPRRPGRRGHPDVFYAEWAKQYVTAWDEDRTGSVYEHMAAKPENAGYSPRTIERYVKQARDKGFLTGSGQGKGGGELTPFCLKVLGKGN